MAAVLADPTTSDEVREGAATALQGTQDPETLRTLAAVLADPTTSYEVREEAATALESAGPHVGVAQALLSGGTVLTDDLRCAELSPGG